jgi:GTPase SAR1 family protein
MITKNYKLCMWGSAGVGKTSLTIQFVTNQFMEDYDPPLQDSYRKKVVVDDEPEAMVDGRGS